MFPINNRFEARIGGDFFATADKQTSPLFVLYLKPNSLDKCRAAVIVPKKIVTKSTGRSNIKRKLKNLLIPHLDRLKGFDIVLYVKSWRQETNVQKLGEEIEKLLSQVK